ncbi:hypothetical protein CH63R_07426 [Colletotrichum higginsianum IMI 349063]|uniref:Uncharacterized protein n=2 Tax=Colletotrichum higginsianum TaxID=80884 RepID=A0A1B7Y991_COLHI|nr:hypothetical protein CH63R_07426 [Colletotrichum higginsianum IMI 349063]OBR08661.1 hypothetical protein CH63R_07426 [Colletotrichum higginsianum IMI 349063]TIC95618.1 hypothetical protein CH35J_008660 [Colletotrichum higginsianum]
MKPRPALPSFGSVREKKPRDAEEERPLVRPLESPPPSDPNTPERNQERAVPNGQSSDYNIGTILSQEQTARNAANISRFREPLPPVVTSLEGSGYYSPTGTDTDDEGDEVFQDPETVQEPECTLPSEQVKEEIIAAHPKLADDTLLPPMQAVPTLDKSIDRDHREEDVPSISVIQPTPTPRETAGNGSADLSEQGYFDVPGGFPEDESEDSVSYPRTQPELTAVTKDRHQQQTTVFNVAATPPAELAPQPVPAEETESEGASIYSDAYEDLSDVDGNGFMSLDAVVASPVPNKVSHKLYQKAMANSSQQTPVDSHANNIPEDVPDFSQLSGSSQKPEDEWERAKVYWRGLTSDKRKQLEQEALEEAGAEGDLEDVVQPVKAKRKKSVRKSDSATQQQASVNPERVYQIQPGTVVIDERDEEEPPATMLKTLRGLQSQETGPANGRLQKTLRGGQTPISAAPGTGLRKTLRSDTPSARSSQPPEPPVMGGMRKSMRQSGPSQGGLASAAGSRPVSLQGPPSSQDQDARPKHLSRDNPMSSVEMARAMQATLRRRASDSSESSFRRARPKQEGLGFRKSMRATTETDPSAAGRNSRFSLRSMSPPTSPASPPVSMSNRTTMRSTLRSDSSDGSTRRVRLPTFGKSSSKKAAGKPSKSRFGDSSDEDDAGPSGFRSRFADSSDEDKNTAPATASRGMSKSTRASTSAAAAAMKGPPPHYESKAEETPDLPDSNDEEAVPSPPVQQKPLSPRKVSGASGRLVKSQSNGLGLQRSGSGRGALVESSTTPSVGTQVMSRPGSHQRRGSFLSVLRRKKENDIDKISRPIASESGARTDTKLERSPSEISALRGTNTSPKLRKQSMHDNWPLFEETIDDEKRPMTADNSKPTDASRPMFMKRRSTNQVLTSGLPEDREDIDGSGKKKKKKFGTLRRMFKLDD